VSLKKFNYTSLDGSIREGEAFGNGYFRKCSRPFPAIQEPVPAKIPHRFPREGTIPAGRKKLPEPWIILPKEGTLLSGGFKPK
jgi:hypothetical protein